MKANEQTGTAPSAHQRIIEIAPSARENSAPVESLIAEIRSKADVFVFLSGGASKMREEDQKRLFGLFDALAAIAKVRRIAVGDGGTRAGIMEAAGKAREGSAASFPLIGIVPSRGVPPRGETPLDPNHSHIVKVDDPAASAQEPWGSETSTMYWLFGRLAEGRPSVTVIANGGGITLSEVDANVRAGRPMILIAGSGRAADAIVSSMRGGNSSDPDVAALQPKVASMDLLRRRELFSIIELEDGPAGLRAAIEAALKPAR